ncbi:MAG: hypothetical protein AB1486_00070 [Planctomycetota bacterium]
MVDPKGRTVPRVAIALVLFIGLATCAGLVACRSTAGDSSGGDMTSEQETQADLLATPDDALTASAAPPPRTTPFAASPSTGPVVLGRVQDRDAQAVLDQQVRREALMREKNRVLVERAIDAAQGFMERADYDKAEAELSRALEIDPANPELIRELRKVQELLGKREGEVATLSELAGERYKVRREQLRLEADEIFKTGIEQMERGNTTEAERSFDTVANYIRWSTLDIDWGDLPERAAEAAERARSAKKEAAAERQRAIEEETFRRLKKEEEDERARQTARIDTLTVAAVDEFDAKNFDKAEKLAQEILAIDPRDDRARELAEAAREARRDQRKTDFVEKRREAFRTWKEQIEEARVPYQGILLGPDPEFWERISKIRGSARNLGLEEIDDPDTARVRRLVETERMPANFQDTAVAEVTSAITNFTGIPVNIDPEVRQQLDDAAATVTLTNLTDVKLSNLLSLICEQLGEELTWTVRSGTVVITSKEKSHGRPVIKIHPIQDITFGLQDFAGPKLDEIQLSTAETFGEEGPGLFGGDLEKLEIIPPADIVTLIRENIAQGSWEDPYVCEEATNNQILVIHTPEVQRQVARFLDDLRRFSSSVVTIHSRFVAITDAFIEEIGADFRGLGNEVGSDVVLDDLTVGLEDKTSQGLDNEGPGADVAAGSSPAAGIFYNDGSDGDIRARTENFWQNPLGSLISTVGGGSFQFALLDDTEFNLVLNLVEKSVNATKISEPILTVYNTNRAYFTMVNEVSYIQDYDVDVANSASIANPQVGIILEGIVLDVRPTISYDRKFITLEVQTSTADLIRPIPSFETTLGGFTVPVQFQVPELETSAAFTTVTVPDGGSVIIGGLKRIRYINRRAAVPWLADIPLIGFFFEEKGVDDEVQDLVVLVRAQITDLNPLRESGSIR